MTVDLSYLGELSTVLQYTQLFPSNLTTSDIMETQWGVISFALQSNNPDVKYFKTLYNNTFGNADPSDLPRLIKTVDHGVDNSMFWQWVCTTPIVLVVVALRLWSRKLIMKKILFSDWLIVIATISTIAYEVELLMAVYYGGAGKHIWDTTLVEIKMNYLFSFIAQVYYFFNSALIKFSLLAFYWSISRDKGYRLAIKILGGVIAVLTILFTVLTIFSCKPIAWWIDPLNVETNCMNRLILFEAQGVISAVTDIFILLLPSLVVIKLQMSRNQKIMVVGLFLLGLVAPISGFYRLVTLMEYSKGTDTTLLEIAPGQWTILEAQIGIVCASVPALKGLFLHFTTKVKESKFLTSSQTRMVTNNQNITRSKTPIDALDMHDALWANEDKKLRNIPLGGISSAPSYPKKSLSQEHIMSMTEPDLGRSDSKRDHDDCEMVTVGFHIDDIEMQRSPGSFRTSSATAVSIGSCHSDTPPPVPPKDY